MVKNVSPFSSPRIVARDRLIHLKGQHGLYQPVSMDATQSRFGTDSFATRSGISEAQPPLQTWSTVAGRLGSMAHSLWMSVYDYLKKLFPAAFAKAGSAKAASAASEASTQEAIEDESYFWNLPVHNLDAPVGLIAVGRDEAELIILDPESAQPIHKKSELPTWRQVDNRLPENILNGMEKTLLGFAQLLDQYEVSPQDTRVVVFPELADMTDSAYRPVPDRFSEVLGLPVEPLSPVDIDQYIYSSVLNHRGTNPNQQYVAITLNDGGLRILPGKGKLLSEEKSIQLPLGYTGVSMMNPFSRKDMVSTANRTAILFEEWVDEDMRQTVQSAGRAFLNRSDESEILRELVLRYTDGELDIYETGLDMETLNQLLSPAGIGFIRQETGHQTLPLKQSMPEAMAV